MSKDFEKEPVSKTEPEPVKKTEPEPVKKTEPVKAVEKERVMSVSQYLTKHELPEGIEGLVASMYAKEIKTEKEWVKTVEGLLTKRVK